MSAKMTPERFTIARRWAREYATANHMQPYHLDTNTIPEVDSAIYVACDWHGTVRYVGSVHRPNNHQGLRERLAEHLRKRHNSRHWTHVWIVELEGADKKAVHRVEGAMGRELDPCDTKMFPGGRGKRLHETREKLKNMAEGQQQNKIQQAVTFQTTQETLKTT